MGIDLLFLLVGSPSTLCFWVICVIINESVLNINALLKQLFKDWNQTIIS